MSIVGKIKRAVRGDVAAKTIALEALRRGRVNLAQRGERAGVMERQQKPARLHPSFTNISRPELLAHFQTRTSPAFFPGFSGSLKTQSEVTSETRDELLSKAYRIISDHSWPLLGLGEKSFGDPINWHRDPISEKDWPLEYHADLDLMRRDGSDVRVLWELNRLPHLLTLARAYAITRDERFSEEFFQQLESWTGQNPYGIGANWNCAMEVALRAMNLLGAFEIFRQSSLLDEGRLAHLLMMFDQHGTFIRRNLEFSYLTTSNHYLSDLIGLFWLGVMLPELDAARGWRDFGLDELLREMDKQVLDDGADFEASTGYHRFVLELFLYSFLLSRANKIEIEERYWRKLHDMLRYTRAYLRPDGFAPLIGDSDSGQVFPICRRSGDDHAYVLAIGAVVFNDASLKPMGLAAPEELPWIVGEQGVNQYEKLEPSEPCSASFREAGTHILRDRDLFLLLNTSGAGIDGRGSHGHNDALSIEVSACGRPFIVDPGSYVYTANLQERHRFRSTAFHSTVQIDDAEQNTTEADQPFVIGDEAGARVLDWETGLDIDRVSVEHYGYTRLPQPVTHLRTVTFNKLERWWLVEDEFAGTGEHPIAVRFHFDSELEISTGSEGVFRAVDSAGAASLVVYPLDLKQSPEVVSQFTSRDYGSKMPSQSVCWSVTARVPYKLRWALVPVCAGEDEAERLGALDLELRTLD